MLLPHRITIGRVVMANRESAQGVIVEVLGPVTPWPPTRYFGPSNWPPPLECRVRLRDGSEMVVDSHRLADVDLRIMAEQVALRRRINGRAGLVRFGATPRDPDADALDLELQRKLDLPI
jgi:hypothetical protein